MNERSLWVLFKEGFACRLCGQIVSRDLMDDAEFWDLLSHGLCAKCLYRNKGADV